MLAYFDQSEKLYLFQPVLFKIATCLNTHLIILPFIRKMKLASNFRLHLRLKSVGASDLKISTMD